VRVKLPVRPSDLTFINPQLQLGEYDDDETISTVSTVFANRKTNLAGRSSRILVALTLFHFQYQTARALQNPLDEHLGRPYPLPMTPFFTSNMASIVC